MLENGCTTLVDYLQRAQSSPSEQALLISALTIHTTHWFREADHFDHILQKLGELGDFTRDSPLRVLSLGCSTGEEVYSFALLLEKERTTRPNFDYQIHGVDIDPCCIRTATRGIYEVARSSQGIPQALNRWVKPGSGRAAGWFTLDKEIRSRCTFAVGDVRSYQHHSLREWNVIICRNLFIYFSSSDIATISRRLAKSIAPGGLLCVGHSEFIDTKSTGLEPLGSSVYRHSGTTEAASLPSKRRQIQGRTRLVVIGASTGGTEALVELLRNMPPGCPPVMVVQHITPSFAKAFGKRLAESSKLHRAEMKSGTKLTPGSLYIADDDYHILVSERDGALYLSTSRSAPVNLHRPSVDVLFQAAARIKHGVIAMLLTGMGKDGAKGLKALRDAGAFTMAQDEASSAVYGMPGEAARIDAAAVIGNIPELRRLLEAALCEKVAA